MGFLKITLLILLILIFWKRTALLAIAARLQFQKGESEKSFRLFRIADKIGRLSAVDRMYYGYALLRTGNLTESRKMLTRSSMDAKKPDMKKRIKAILALVTWKEGNLDEAIQMMEEAIEDFKNTNFYQNLGLMYVLKGDAQKAIEFNEEAYEYNSDDMIIADNLAESYALGGKLEDAKKLYEELLAKEPHFPEPYYCYGLLLVSEGQRDRGIELIRESLSKRFSFLSVKTKEEVEKLLENI